MDVNRVDLISPPLQQREKEERKKLKRLEKDEKGLRGSNFCIILFL
jgi:hypothetical protein